MRSPISRHQGRSQDFRLGSDLASGPPIATEVRHQAPDVDLGCADGRVDAARSSDSAGRRSMCSVSTSRSRRQMTTSEIPACWKFWVVSTRRLDNELGSQKTVGLSTLDGLARARPIKGWSEIMRIARPAERSYRSPPFPALTRDASSDSMRVRLHRTASFSRSACSESSDSPSPASNCSSVSIQVWDQPVSLEIRWSKTIGIAESRQAARTGAIGGDADQRGGAPTLGWVPRERVRAQRVLAGHP